MDIVLAYAREVAIAIGGIVLVMAIARGLTSVIVTKDGEEHLHIIVKED